MLMFYLGNSGKQKNDADDKPETPTPKSAKRGDKGKNDKKEALDKRASASKVTPQTESTLSDEIEKDAGADDHPEPPEK